MYRIHTYNYLHYGECIDAKCIAIQLSPEYDNGNTHTRKFEHSSSTHETEVFRFVGSLDNVTTFDHNTETIKLDNDVFVQKDDINHSLSSPRVMGIVSNNIIDESTLLTYRGKMVLDPMFSAMDRTSNNDTHSFFGHRYGVNDKSWYVRGITSKELLSI